ncbi:hypothetical protein [Secundilactobacillus odoratitofui]|uniref:hypothetical protein n=1 Tax=Secundilactobacillus odoratitofui TaxID=480930 RepID=UPI00070494DF|nr:hypothetical protein [Secundilactobacillus odoratitofui]
MKDVDVIQYLTQITDQQHNDLITVLTIFIAIISLGAIFTGVLQWRFSDKQIEKMKIQFKKDYGIDDLKNKVKEANELNEKLKLTITSNARMQIDSTGSLLPLTQTIEDQSAKGNIVGNFTGALISAQQLGLLEGPLLREGVVYVCNFMRIFTKRGTDKKLSKPELGNLVTALDLLERQMADKPILPKLAQTFEARKAYLYKKYDVDKLKREDKERQTKEAKEKILKKQLQNVEKDN